MEEDDFTKDGAMNKTLAIAIIMSIGVAVHAAEKEATVAQFTLSSPSFRNNQPMPAIHTCEGKDASPALKWEGAPAGTKSFALIADDPDAPGGTWVHWLIYGIATNVTEITEGQDKMETLSWAAFDSNTQTVKDVKTIHQGVNSFGNFGYGGPCPPRGHGMHHYHFRLYALDVESQLASGVKRQHLEAAMKGHILAQAELVGTYQRD